MPQLKSGSHVCADKLLLASSTQIVTTAWLRKGNEAQVSQPIASTIIHQLKKANSLVPSGRGRYIARPDKIEQFFRGKTFKKAQKKTVEAVREASSMPDDDNSDRDMFGDGKKEPASLQQTTSVHPDIDVINSLLDAIAAAEPVLQKYKRMCEAAHS